MTATMTQKLIKVGSSKGAIFPAAYLKELGVDVGDDLEITIRKKSNKDANDAAVLKTARDILDRYEKDFANLAKR